MSKLTRAPRLLCIAFAGGLLPGFGAARTAVDPGVGSVVVNIDGFRTDSGIARVAVFDEATGFPDKDDHALRRAASKIDGGRVEVRFDSLPYGVYAVAVYHDENADGKLNKGLFGRPKEGYGVSNNVVHARHAPTFDEAQFPLDSDLTTLEIHVHY